MTNQDRERIRLFSGEQNPKTCRHKHKREGTGGVFYDSFGYLQCARCRGWQLIRKPVS